MKTSGCVRELCALNRMGDQKHRIEWRVDSNDDDDYPDRMTDLFSASHSTDRRSFQFKSM